MNLFFTNPWGLLGLLGIPAVILIHFFQKRSRKFVVSTMFLIENWQDDARKGTTFEKLRNTLPLWLQLLAVLLFTWLLTQPRWLKEDTIQRVVIVQDTSASMAAFAEETYRQLSLVTDELQRMATTTEWALLASHRPGSPLYRGQSRGELLATVQQVFPIAGTHEFTDALRDARISAGTEGTVILVTDRRPPTLEEGITLLLTGQPIDNVGIAGVRVVSGEDGNPRWLASIRNFGQSTADFEWHLESEGQRNEGTPTRLEAGQVIELRGRFPEGKDRMAIVLSHDSFLSDNRADLIIPRAKPLNYALELNRPLPFAERLAETLPNATRTGGGTADVIFSDTPRILPPQVAGIFFKAPNTSTDNIAIGDIIVERHPLTQGLSFNGLLFQGKPSPPTEETDRTVLVWFDRIPLIYLETHDGSEQLIFNFSFEGSNVDRLPSTVLLTRRFVEKKREAKFAPFADNFETGQRLNGIPPRTNATFAIKDAAGNTTTSNNSFALRAPELPGPFSVTVDGQLLVEGTARLADTREFDFTNAVRADIPSLVPAGKMDERFEDDFFAPVWLLAIAGLVFASWYYSERYGL